MALAALGFSALLAIQACHREGPAERAGESVDNALDDHDLSAGPAQKVGKDLDKATDKANAATHGDKGS